MDTAVGVTEGPLYEYACHEGNHAIVGVLKGGRATEKALTQAGRPSSN
jgi:hypothetical protein